MTTYVPLRNEKDYKKDYKQFIDVFLASAAAMFKNWEDDEKIKDRQDQDEHFNQVIDTVKKLGRTLDYLLISKEDGIAHFKYWYATNTD